MELKDYVVIEKATYEEHYSVKATSMREARERILIGDLFEMVNVKRTVVKVVKGEVYDAQAAKEKKCDK